MTTTSKTSNTSKTSKTSKPKPEAPAPSFRTLSSFDQLRDVFAQGLTRTSLADLHPFDQERAAKAADVLNEAFGNLEDPHTVGISHRAVTAAHFAAIRARRGQALSDRDAWMDPAKCYGATIGSYADRGEVPSPSLVVVQSEQSARCAVCVLVWRSVDRWSGFGDPDTADAFLLAVCGDHREAREYVQDVVGAARTIDRVCRVVEARAELAARSTAADDRPAF